MIDRGVMVALLSLLDQLDGQSLEERVLMNEISYKAVQPLSSDLLQEHIQEAKQKGWIEKEAGLIRGEIRWRRTLGGRAALMDMR